MAEAGKTGGMPTTSSACESESSAGTRSVRAEIQINASPEAVWEALTTAEGLSRWFPIEARVKPGEGGEIWFSWGKEVMEGTSRIVVWEPPRRLVTQWDWMRDEFVIEGKGGVTVLRVTSSGFGEGADWDAMLDSVTSGWGFELNGLKHYLERHAGEERVVVRASAPTDLSAREAFQKIAPAPLLEAKAGERFELELADGLTLHGRVASNHAPTDFGAVVDEFNGAYLRIQVEPPCGGGEDKRIHATLWLSTYGVGEAERGRVREIFGRTLREKIGNAVKVS